VANTFQVAIPNCKFEMMSVLYTVNVSLLAPQTVFSKLFLGGRQSKIGAGNRFAIKADK
jgi:hypothetical protein